MKTGKGHSRGSWDPAPRPRAWQVPLRRGDTCHRPPVSPNPLQELLHQRVTKGRLVAKSLVTGGNGCCIQLNGGTPANNAVLKEKLTRLCMPGGSDSFPCTNANPNQITLKQAVVDPVQAVWMVCTTRIDNPGRLNLSLTQRACCLYLFCLS